MTTYLDFFTVKDKKSKEKNYVSYAKSFALMPIAVGSVVGSSNSEVSFESKKGKLLKNITSSYTSLEIQFTN